MYFIKYMLTVSPTLFNQLCKLLCKQFKQLMTVITYCLFMQTSVVHEINIEALAREKIFQPDVIF